MSPTAMLIAKVVIVLIALVAAWKAGGWSAVRKLAIQDLVDLLTVHKVNTANAAAEKSRSAELAKRVIDAIGDPSAPAPTPSPAPVTVPDPLVAAVANAP